VAEGVPSGPIGPDAAADAFEEALRRHDAVALYDRAPCGYLSTAPDGRISSVNQTFLTWTGFARDHLVGERRFADLLSPGGRIYHETHYAPMLHANGTTREIALEIVRADGQRLPVLVNSVMERDDGGRPVAIHTAVFDATERRAYERELLRAKQRAEASEARASALARTLQQTLIPPSPPVVPGLDVAAAYRPAGDGEEVGGDFYDVFEIADGDWAVALGDVRGKGVEAAVVTTLVRFTLRGISVREPRPSAALRTLNEVLLHHQTDRFCTAVLARLRRTGQRWVVTLSCGGHPLPVLARHGAAPEPLGRTGTLLGVLEDPELHDTAIELGPGDVLVLYTDGVTEGRRGRTFFGAAGLLDSIGRAGGSAAAVADGVLSDLLRFQQGDARDDIALVAVRVPHPDDSDDADDDPDHIPEP
jgi:sigma-B regulation protein RsbU (phosphoserine phosphatase)